MKTVKTKKELIEAIKNGEKEVYVDSKRLFLACRMAERYGGSPSDLTDKSPKVLAFEMGLSETVAIALILSALILAIAIITVLAKYEVVIETEADPKTGKLKGRVILRKKLR